MPCFHQTQNKCKNENGQKFIDENHHTFVITFNEIETFTKNFAKIIGVLQKQTLKATIIHFHSLLSTLEKHIVVGGTCGNMHARHHPWNKSPLSNPT